jgi:hypothetical protein
MDFWNDNTTFVAQNEKFGLKKYVKVMWKINKTSSNEKFISEMHWNFLIYIISINFKWHDYYKFLSLRIHFTLKNLIFYMYFLINHMFKNIHRLAY